jgi:hypothetical protein
MYFNENVIKLKVILNKLKNRNISKISRFLYISDNETNVKIINA